MSEANNPASEASLAKFGAKRQFFASSYEMDKGRLFWTKVFEISCFSPNLFFKKSINEKIVLDGIFH